MTSVLIPGTQLHISRLAFGCARLAAGAELSLSAKLIDSALKCGITHFDTAPLYGSESLLGEVIGDMRGITIATKVGLPRSAPHPGRTSMLRTIYRRTVRPMLGRFPRLKSALLRSTQTSSPPENIVKRVMIRDEIHRELEESLRQLKRTRVDVYLIHEPEKIVVSDEIRETFEDLKSGGTIGAYGFGFGGEPSVDLDNFGTIDQFRYSADVAARPGNRLSIFHGVLRHALHHPVAGRPRQDAKDLIADVLKRHPGSAILFSASSSHQIKQICSAAQLT